MKIYEFCRSHARKFGWFCCISTAVLVSIIVLFAFVLVYTPKELKISISDASLTQFTFSESNKTLSYALELHITRRNPNKKGRLLFDRVQVVSTYKTKPFSALNLTSTTPFHQGRRNTTVLRSIHRGIASFSLENARDFQEYRVEMKRGVYSIDVKLNVRVRVKYSGIAETRYFEAPEIMCDKLSVPLQSLSSNNNNYSNHGSNEKYFRAIKCRNIFIFKGRDKHRGPGTSDYGCTIWVPFVIFLYFIRPYELKFAVTDASLEQFNLSSYDNSTLSYDFSLNFTVRNPNKKIGVFYDLIKVVAEYHKKSFASVTLNSTTPFYQSHKNTTVLHSVLQGQQKLLLKEKDVKRYYSERVLGVFRVDVKIYLHVRANYNATNTVLYYRSCKVHCGKLKVPLSGSMIFKTSKCKKVDVFSHLPYQF